MIPFFTWCCLFVSFCVCCLIISRIGMLKLLGLLQWLYLKLKQTYGRFQGCSSSCYLYEHSWLWTHLNICLGVVKSKRSIWRISTITDFFWSIINFIRVFFATMFSMEKSDNYRKGSRSSKKWDGGPGGPGSGPYGGGGPRGPSRGLDNVRGLNDVRGNDHSSLPACGSCCGG